MSDEETDWREVAQRYGERLRALSWWVAFAAYIGSGLAVVRMLDAFHVDGAWTESIAALVWLPLGVAALWLRSRLEAWALAAR